MAEPTIAAGFARGLLEFAIAKGASSVTLTARSGIALGELDDPDKRISVAKYIALLRAAKALTGDPALMLHFAEMSDLSELSLMGMIAPSFATMDEAFSLLNRYARLGIDVESATLERFQLVPDNSGIWLVDTRINPNDFFELTEGTFTRFVCNIGLLARASGVPADTSIAKMVHVTHSDPGYGDEYERVLRAPVVFDSDRNALLLNRVVLSTRTPEAPTYAVRVMSERADVLLERLDESQTIRGRVEQLLAPILQSGDVSMDKIADQLGCTRSTLLRQLKTEGVTFEKVLDELRHKTALHLLTAEKVSVKEAAYLVGFSEAAAFSRAFKRWTGTSPRAAQSAKKRVRRPRSKAKS